MMTKQKAASVQRRERKAIATARGGCSGADGMMIKRKVAPSQRRERERALARAGGGPPAQTK